MAIVVEPLASADEIDDVLAVEAVSFTNPWTREMYLADLENQGVTHILLAKDDSRRVVGFCSFWHVIDEIRINNLAVVPEYRRRGVGSEILWRVFSEARRLGATWASLEVRRSNDPARRLYARFGFVLAGIRAGYYTRPPEDAVVLRRDGFPPDRRGDIPCEP